MAAQDDDEEDRDFMMSSSSPVLYDAAGANEGAARLVEDMVQCQLESGVDVGDAIQAVEASADVPGRFGETASAFHSSRSLDMMFRPYSMRQRRDGELIESAIQG